MRRHSDFDEKIQGFSGEPLTPIVQLWVLRILVRLEGLERLLRESLSVHPLLESLGVRLADIDDDETQPRLQRTLKRQLKPLWERAERNAGKSAVPAALADNVGRLADLVHLSDAECRILEFVCLLHTVRELDDTADALGSLTTSKVLTLLPHILGLTADAVKQALSPKGRLALSGLVKVDDGAHLTMRAKLDLLSGQFADAILTPEAEPMSLLRGVVAPSAPARLQLDDYPHLGLNLQMLLAYLRGAQQQQRPGVNVLLYGPPGTGKTELSRALARELGCELFEVACEDEDQNPISGDARLQAYRAAQRFLQGERVMLLFDEIEDVFQGHDLSGLFGGIARFGAGSRTKGLINQMLESNTVPTFWLTNAVRNLDGAYIRRFDFVLELPVPPQPVRQRIAAACVGEQVDAATVRALAASDVLAPAVLTRASAVLHTIGERLPPPQTAPALLQLVNNTLQAQGHATIAAHDPSRLPEVYDPALVNTDADLTALVEGIARRGSARLCLYGPPGTGKTAYARWLAERLQRPLLVKRASDLLSKWLGESERNIAETFRQAERERAILLIDEVDGLLQERRGATHSWEVTQVNELLTQMETFSGVFVATTNLVQGLDQAALRRFDLKAKLDYLRPEQAQALLRAHGQHLELHCSDAALAAVARLPSLTPGDFAAVVRRHGFAPLADCGELVQSLADECALKDAPKAVLGFV
ncbi:MAG: ATP-binding protein [Pseudomonadota bacterium]